MTDREYPHPRALIERLDTEQLRDLADDLSLQLASLEIALEQKSMWSAFGRDQPSDARGRAAKIITNSTSRCRRR